MQTVNTATLTPSMSPHLDAAMTEAERLYTLCAQAQGTIKVQGERPLSPTSTDWDMKLDQLRSAMLNNMASDAKNISPAQMSRLLKLLDKMMNVVPINFLQHSDSIDLILDMMAMCAQSGRRGDLASHVTTLQSRRQQRLALGRGV